jgi:hypothetical protein
VLPGGYARYGGISASLGDFFRHIRRKSPTPPISPPSSPVFGPGAPPRPARAPRPCARPTRR